MICVMFCTTERKDTGYEYKQEKRNSASDSYLYVGYDCNHCRLFDADSLQLGVWNYGPNFFIMGGQIKQKLKNVTGGAMTGLIVSYLLCIAIPALSGIIGEKLGWIVPVTLVVAALMLLRPLFPYVCNNVAFLYMVIATKDGATFFAEFWSLLGLFVVGGIIYLGGILLILKMLQKRAAKKAQIK